MFFGFWYIWSCFSSITILQGCAFDKQAIRQDDQEKIFLQQSAQKYWEGVRWGIPSKSAVYYEHPLFRARWENNPIFPYSKVTEVNILHIEIHNSTEPSTQPETTTIQKTATVYVFVQGIASDNTLQSQEIQQKWYRNNSGWFVYTNDLSDVQNPESPN